MLGGDAGHLRRRAAPRGGIGNSELVSHPHARQFVRSVTDSFISVGATGSSEARVVKPKQVPNFMVDNDMGAGLVDSFRHNILTRVKQYARAEEVAGLGSNHWDLGVYPDEGV